MSNAPHMHHTFRAKARAIAVTAQEPVAVAFVIVASLAKLALIGLGAIGIVAVLEAFANY